MDKVHNYYETSCRQSILHMGHATSCATGPTTGHATIYGHCNVKWAALRKKKEKKKTIQVSFYSHLWPSVSKCPPPAPALAKLLLNYRLQVLANESSLLVSQRTLIHYYPRTRRQKKNSKFANKPKPNTTPHQGNKH